MDLAIGFLKSKSCSPYLSVVSVHGALFSIKLDHIVSQVLHLNSPGALSIPTTLVIL
jgi:hypothetical protein